MQPSALPRKPRSYRAARPGVARVLPTRGREPRVLRAFSSLLVVAVLVGATLALFELNMAGRIYPGVRLGGVDVGGLSRDEALGRLRAAGDAYAATRLVLLGAGRTWSVTPAQLGFRLDVAASVDAAYRLGRGGTLAERLQEQARLLVEGRSLALTGTYSGTALRAYVTTVAAQVDRPARSAALSITPNGAQLQVAAQTGARLDVPGAMRLLAAALIAGQPATVRLPVVVTQPAVSTAAALRESARLSRLLAARIGVTALGHSWRLTRADLAALLRPATVRHGSTVIYTHAVDRAAVAAYVWPRASSVDRPGRDARIIYQEGVVRVTSGRDGRVVDRGAAAAQLAAAVERGSDVTVAWPVVNGPTVSNAEAAAVAARLRRTLRTTVVWLPQRHWAITPRQIAAALSLQYVPAITGGLLVPHLDAAAIANALPGSAALVSVPARDAAVVKRGTRYVVVPAVAGRRPNYAALAAEMLAAPPGRAVYHLPIASYAPALTTKDAAALARAHKVTAPRPQGTRPDVRGGGRH